MMTAGDLRQKFLEFFKEKGHTVIPSASLVPENDPSVLFTTAGMHPLVPYLLGEKHPLGKRLVNVQKCLRTDDIDEVGDSQHLTFFEMLGYWSLGDYFKKESIKYTFEFYTEVLGFSKDDISVSVFAGDEDASFDEESYNTWKDELGIPENRIYKYPKKENWWGPVGETGPCGPDTEMFIDTGIEPCSKECGPSCGCDKFVEIGNNVFMEYFKTDKGVFEKLEQKNVDVGLGFERLVMFSQSKKSVFEIDIFEPIIKKIEDLSGKKYSFSSRHPELDSGSSEAKSFRIIADHIKAAVFAINDGVDPSNKGAGYVVRRLIRRAIVKANQIGIKDNFTTKLADVVFDIYDDTYFSTVIPTSSGVIPATPSVIPAKAGIQTLDPLVKPEDDKRESAQDDIKKELEKEETKFRKNLISTLKELEFYATFWQGDVKPIRNQEKVPITGEILFNLFQSKGLPVEIALEEAKRLNLNIEEGAEKEFYALLKSHQEKSRTASAGMFKGGLADAGDRATKYHTATHLLLAALRKILGDHVLQKGSNITAERLRFDFSHPEKMTDEQIQQVEDLVNEQIANDLPVTMEEMTIDEAKKSGAVGVFESKYGDKVKVYTIGGNSSTSSGRSEPPFSREICGGPHVDRIGQLGHFKIQKEESSSSGVRRVKAVLE